ncbi:epidermal growth factor-like protein [Musca domestica]|uniref:Wnt inhibitory factor 1 n=1 Tax=Musca domestica TaxID=7370 RepID=A0A1I8M3R5_MUSDO|nr:epidermal growth factor-like protein [Musca domestica]
MIIRWIVILTTTTLLLKFSDSIAYELNDPPPPCSAYEMLIVNTKQCVSRCPIRCIDDNCFEDGECPCENSYMTSFENGLICAQQCLPGCIEAGGYCAGPDICVCKHKGSAFDPVTRKCWKHSIFRDKCQGRCLYGHCNHEGICTCAQGFRSTNNIFGQLCEPVCKQKCGPRGYCFLPNMCACRKKHEHYGPNGLCYHDDVDYIF